MTYSRTILPALALAASMISSGPAALAAGVYDKGASETEILLGSTAPYSGPLSIYGVLGKVQDAYFQMLNDRQGGINGRKVKVISYDDAYNPAKTVEQVRKLIERDGVLAAYGILGSPTNAAILKYMNGRKIPQLFTISGATKFGDYENYPWTMSMLPNYATEAAVYGKAILEDDPQATIAVLYQNDDFGRDYLEGLKRGLGDKIDQLVGQEPYETSEPTIDSHILNLKASNADAVVLAATAKFASQAIRKIGELDWSPQIYISNTAVSKQFVLQPAGLDHSKGIISASYRKDPSDPAWTDDPDMMKYIAFMKEYLPSDPPDGQAATGYVVAQAMAHVLQEAGDDLTRKNLMKVARSIDDVPLELLLPGMSMSTSETDHFPLEQLQLMRFDGESWELFGDIISFDQQTEQ